MFENTWPKSWKQRPTHFKPSEFGWKAKPQAGLNMKPDFLWKLELVRVRMGRPMTINSGYRDKAHNKAVGGAANSAHLYGRAADVSTVGWPAWVRKQFVKECQTVGIFGIGIGRTFIHIDDMTTKDGFHRPLVWLYDSNNKQVPLVGSTVPEAAW